jgi:hypothetical protein
MSHWTGSPHFYLPLTVAGVPTDTVIRNEAVQIFIEAPNGLHWSSNWQSVSQSYLPNSVRSFIDIPVDFKFLNRIQATSVHVTVSFALIELRAGTTETVQAGEQGFSISEGGKCSVSSFRGEYPGCRFAERRPGLTLVTARWTDGPCAQTPLPTASGPLGDVWIGAVDPAPAEFGLDPVKAQALIFSNQPRDGRHSSFICPGTPIIFTPYSTVRRFQTALIIPNLDLTKYTTDHPERIAMSYSIANDASESP